MFCGLAVVGDRLGALVGGIAAAVDDRSTLRTGSPPHASPSGAHGSSMRAGRASQGDAAAATRDADLMANRFGENAAARQAPDPHPNPLPQAGEGIGVSSLAARAGEGRGRGPDDRSVDGCIGRRRRRRVRAGVVGRIVSGIGACVGGRVGAGVVVARVAASRRSPRRRPRRHPAAAARVHDGAAARGQRGGRTASSGRWSRRMRGRARSALPLPSTQPTPSSASAVTLTASSVRRAVVADAEAFGADGCR